MRGLYLHIPFCRQACHYCDFHFSTSLAGKARLLSALHRELEIGQEFWGPAPFRTVYFGGGTPSLLEIGELASLLDTIARLYGWEAGAEITLEANPDDLNPSTLAQWRALGINRLSLGIQSFDGATLAFMNRAHDAAQAQAAVPMIREAGFDNFSVDLIYGRRLGTQDSAAAEDRRWKEDVEKVLHLAPPHVSAYSLTLEPDTAFGRWAEKGQVLQAEEEQMAAQHLYLRQALASVGVMQYEISNYARPGWESQHNSAYWQGLPYWGLGPSAHSFDGAYTRWSLPAHNIRYAQSLEAGEWPRHIETLDDFQRLEEWLLTGFRTRWGVPIEALRRHQAPLEPMQAALRPFVEEGLAEISPQAWRLTPEGFLLADYITAQLLDAAR